MALKQVNGCWIYCRCLVPSFLWSRVNHVPARRDHSRVPNVQIKPASAVDWFLARIDGSLFGKKGRSDQSRLYSSRAIRLGFTLYSPVKVNSLTRWAVPVANPL